MFSVASLKLQVVEAGQWTVATFCMEKCAIKSFPGIPNADESNSLLLITSNDKRGLSDLAAVAHITLLVQTEGSLTGVKAK